MTEDLRHKYIGQIYDAAAALYYADMPELTEEKFTLFETVGNRLEYEHDYFERRKFLTVYGCAALLCCASGDNETAGADTVCVKCFEKAQIVSKLTEIIEDICSEECWALPAHVNRKADPDWRITVDLFASETAQAISELYNRLEGVLPETLREKMRAEVMRRVLEPFAAKEPYAWWERSDMNWNAVCNGSIGMAALDLLDDEAELQGRIVRRVYENLNSFLDGFADDGACLEGIGYFTYGFYYYMGFMDLLAKKAETNTNIHGLLRATGASLPEKCRRIAEFQQKCYFPSGLSVSFSDGSKHEKYRIGLTCKLAGLYDSVELPDIASAADFDFDPCYRFLMAERDISWSGEYLKLQGPDVSQCGQDDTCHDSTTANVKSYEKNGLKSYLLPSAQWAIAHGRSGGGFAVKGGHNAEPHNHNDVGSFIYALGDRPLLTDLGAGEYTAQYFKEETRFGYICCSSLGHNVPVINGHGQQAGREYACDGFSADGGTVRLSFAGAYGDPALRSLNRSIKYDPDSERLTVEDVFDSDGCLIEENLVTQDEVEKLDNGIVIRVKIPDGENPERTEGKNLDYTCRIICENGFPNLKITEESFMNHEGQPETVKRITWKVADRDQKGTIVCRFMIEQE